MFTPVTNLVRLNKLHKIDNKRKSLGCVFTHVGIIVWQEVERKDAVKVSPDAVDRDEEAGGGPGGPEQVPAILHPAQVDGDQHRERLWPWVN